MSIRAFEVLDSSCTCFITVCLIVLESMVGLMSFNWQGAKKERVGCWQGRRKRSMMASALRENPRACGGAYCAVGRFGFGLVSAQPLSPILPQGHSSPEAALRTAGS